MKILVFGVESTRARQPLERVLARLGHETFATSDCDAAVTCIGHEGIPVIIADGRLPKFGWIDLCRRLRAGGSKTRVHFILIEDATADESHEEWAIEAGVDDFLGQVADESELRRRLRLAAGRTGSAKIAGIGLSGGPNPVWEDFMRTWSQS